MSEFNNILFHGGIQASIRRPPVEEIQTKIFLDALESCNVTYQKPVLSAKKSACVDNYLKKSNMLLKAALEN